MMMRRIWTAKPCIMTGLWGIALGFAVDAHGQDDATALEALTPDGALIVGIVENFGLPGIIGVALWWLGRLYGMAVRDLKGWKPTIRIVHVQPLADRPLSDEVSLHDGD